MLLCSAKAQTVCAYADVCVCVYIYICVSVCLCVSVCVVISETTNVIHCCCVAIGLLATQLAANFAAKRIIAVDCFQSMYNNNNNNHNNNDDYHDDGQIDWMLQR